MQLLPHILLLALAAQSLLPGCAGLPMQVVREPSHALADVEQTYLGRVAANSLPANDAAASGFRVLPEGPAAFNARIALMRRAEKSLDVQYYLIGNDKVGRLFLRELRDAALRGVRVRLLVDDIYTAGEDPLLAGLAAFPNVQVRLFNPLPSRSDSLGWRILLSLDDFSRVNHRMHNKLFIADNSLAVSGGRNIADEYFMQSATDNFIDVDVLSSGPVVRQMSQVFDSYWNSRHAFPIGSLDAATLPAAQARQQFDALVQHAGALVEERAHDVLGQTPVSVQLDAGKLEQVSALARVFADNPDKVGGADPAAGPTVAQQTMELIASARESVRITSPYFIPGERGLAMIRAVEVKGADGRVTLVTNSLESTDEPLVYAAYAKYRIALLKAGVHIYEIGSKLSRRSTSRGDFGHSIARLHAKVAIIDRRLIFIGSMNMDPRSRFENTEMGLVIDSAALAQMLSSLFQQRVTEDAFRLRLTADGEQIEWLETEANGSLKVHREEPGNTWWPRLQIWLLSPFVDASLL